MEISQIILKDHKERKSVFRLYMPSEDKTKYLFLAIPGLGANGDLMLNSPYTDFCEKKKLPMVVPIFPFSEKEWYVKTSYHFTEAWSGKITDRALKTLFGSDVFKRRSIFIFGFSAGGQFGLSYSTEGSRNIKGVAAHGFGGYPQIKEKIKTTYFLTVGDGDHPDRISHLNEFTEKCEILNIPVKSTIIKGLDHSITRKQIDDSLKFFNRLISNF